MKKTIATAAAAALMQCTAGLATGFYRVEHRGGDSWQVVDPRGNDTFILGIDHVKYTGHWCEKLGAYPHLAEMKKKFPDIEDWRKDTISRLKGWGFNMLGDGYEPGLSGRGLLHTATLSAGDSWATDPDEDKWICANLHRPCTAFPNVFHPDWRKHCEELAAKICATGKDDKNLFGYFIDNELAWWGRARQWTSAEGLFEEALKRKPGHAAREAALAMLKERGVKPGETIPADVKEQFLRRAAELYFGATSAAVRAVDPNHLVLGSRFAGMGGAHPLVWETAGKYCDLVTFNCYPHADLDRNIAINDAWSRRELAYDAFKRTYDYAKKPLMITEWSFPALDSGLPCQHGAGQRFHTQAERAAASELFAKTMLAAPFFIGYDYFMWVDEPALGISRAFPEDTNYGLVNNKGEAYPEITSMFRRLHSDIPRWRKGCIEAQPGGRYAIRGENGLLLEGGVGDGRVFSSVSLSGVRYGSFNVMLALKDGDAAKWCDADKVVSAERKGNVLEVVAAHASGVASFEVALRFSSPDPRGRVSVEALQIANKGPAPIAVDKVVFREYPGFDGGCRPRRRIPNMWKPVNSAAWLSNEGRIYAASTPSEACTGMRYWSDDYGPHPDSFFKPAIKKPAPKAGQPHEIKPGRSVGLSGVWMHIELH